MIEGKEIKNYAGAEGSIGIKQANVNFILNSTGSYVEYHDPE